MSRVIELLAIGTAILGGVVLLGVVAITCFSITGRALVPIGLGPIPGDYELTEIGVAFAVFAALPLCHLKRGHASVELLTPYFGASVNRALDLLTDGIVFAGALLITWRLFIGMADKKSYSETTFILQVEIWQAYALALWGCAVFCLVAAFRLGESLSSALRRPVR